jgi:CDP-paratose 2-epimerase
VFRDFEVNATGTLNMLEAFRRHGRGGAFVHLSTNKVYGDVPNYLDYEEQETRYTPTDPMLAEHGFDETTSVDNTKHSLFGCSKLAGDIYAQEYGRYYGMPAVIFRGGCLTGGGHAGAELHGFLSYLFKAGVSGIPYKVFGYKGKQVRDNIHATDVAKAALACISKPVAYNPGEVFNIGGELERSCSVLEAIDACSKRTGKHFDYSLVDDARIGDHKWWSSDMTKFKTIFPDWKHTYSLDQIYDDIYESALRAKQ